MSEIELCPMTPEHDAIMEVLIKVARRKGTISYTDLMRQSKVKLDMSIPYEGGYWVISLGKSHGMKLCNSVQCFQVSRFMQVITNKDKDSLTLQNVFIILPSTILINNLNLVWRN